MHTNLLFFITIFFFLCTDTTAQDLKHKVPEHLEEFSYEELDSLVVLHHSRGNFFDCIPYMQACKDKAKKEFGEQDSIYAGYTSDLGFFYKITMQFQKAEQLYLEAKKIKLKVLGNEHPHYARMLNTLSRFYKETGRFEQAESYLLEEQYICNKMLGKEHPRYATCLNNLALLYRETGRLEQAEPLMLEAKNIFTKVLGKEHLTYAIGLNNLASLYQDIGSYELAEPLLLEAQNIFYKVLGKDDRRYATSINNLAALYQKMDKFAKAKPLMIEANNIYAKVLGKYHPSYAKGINNLAVVNQQMGNYAEAELLYLEAHKILGQIYENEHPFYAYSLKNLSVLYKTMGRLDSAYLCSMASIDANCAQIDRSFYLLEAENSPQQSSIYTQQFSDADVGSLDTFEYYSNQHILESLNTLLKIIKAKYNKSNDKTILEQHYKIVKAAMRLNERIRNNFSSEGNKLRTLRTNNDFVTQGIETALLLEKDIFKEEAFSFSEQNKSILLADAVKGNRARVLGDLPDSLINREILFQKKMSGLKEQRFKAGSTTKSSKSNVLLNYNKSLAELNLEIDEFLKSLKDKYPKYHALKYENITAKVDDIQALLDEKTLLIEYFQTDSLLYFFTVSKYKVEVYPLHISRSVLKEKIQKLRYALSNYAFILKNKKEAFRLYSQLSYWFYKEILETGLQDTSFRNLIIIADGELGYLPFEVFLMEQVSQKESNYNNLHYLIKKYNISYNYSATLWKDNLTTKTQRNNGSMLACAAAYPSLDSSLLKHRLPHFFNLRGKLNPLPAAHHEIVRLSENFQGDFLLKDSTNEQFFKENAHNYGIIHLAMHGILDSRTPMLSSLVFTENRDTVEDNFLQAFEIARLKLRADLVVLSACETGYGEFEQGEGIVSLARSFMYAGVPSLVVSLWQVNDNSTSLIMQAFYLNLADGMDKACALRQAKLSYLQDARGVAVHPAFWSPFILVGDNSPVNLVGKNGWGLWIVWAAFILVAFVGIVIRKRKYKT